MKLRLESFGELRLIDPAGRPAAFPEKGLLAICYLRDRDLRDGAGSEYPRSALARFLWDSHDNSDIMEAMDAVNNEIVDLIHKAWGRK